MNSNDKRKVAILISSALAMVFVAVILGKYELSRPKPEVPKQSTITFSNPDEGICDEFNKDDIADSGATVDEGSAGDGSISID